MQQISKYSMNGLAVQPNIVLPTSSMDDWGLQMPNVGAAKKPFLGIYPKTLGQLGSGLKSMAGAIGGAVGTMAHGLISDGYSSGAGNAVGSVGGGTTIIPVYIGQERIDEIVVRATQNSNYRSGGR